MGAYKRENFIGKRVPVRMVIPAWYGLAYYDFPSKELVCYPIPINIAVRSMRSIKYLLTTGLIPDLRSNEAIKSYQAGIEDMRHTYELDKNRLRKEGWDAAIDWFSKDEIFFMDDKEFEESKPHWARRK